MNNSPNERQVVLSIVLLIIIGLSMIRSGWRALRQPSRTLFWTDRTGLWLTERTFGTQAKEELEVRLRAESRIRRVGKQGIAAGVWALLGAIILLGLAVLDLL